MPGVLSNQKIILLRLTGSGTGDVVGPASSTDNAIVRFDGAGGKTLQNSVVTIADTTGAMAWAAGQTVSLRGGATTDAFTFGGGASEWGRFAPTTGNLLIGGTTDITGSGGLKVFGTTAATSTTTGSLINAGGFGNAGALYVGGLANIAGNLVMSSNTQFLITRDGEAIRLIQNINGDDQLFTFYTAASAARRGYLGYGTAGSDAFTIQNETAAGGISFGVTGVTSALAIAGTTGDTTLAGDLTVSGGNVGVGGAVDATIGVYVRTAIASGASQYGVYSAPVFSSAATTQGIGGQFKVTTAAAAFTVTDAYTVFAESPTLGAASAITTQRGLYVANQGASGVTNAYGIDIAAQSGAATTNVGLRNAGTSLLTGLVAIGGATISSTTAIILPASTTGVSSIRIPHGAAPTSPVNGDFWTDTSAAYIRINGVTKTLAFV